MQQNAAIGNNYFEAEVLTATPQKLQLMMIEGAIRFTSKAKKHLQEEEFGEFCESVIRAEEIVCEILASLDMDSAPELIPKIASVYLFIYRRLMEANLERSVEMLDDALRILAEERTTWKMVCEKHGAKKGVVPNDDAADISSSASVELPTPTAMPTPGAIPGQTPVTSAGTGPMPTSGPMPVTPSPRAPATYGAPQFTGSAAGPAATPAATPLETPTAAASSMNATMPSNYGPGAGAYGAGAGYNAPPAPAAGGIPGGGIPSNLGGTYGAAAYGQPGMGGGIPGLPAQPPAVNNGLPNGLPIPPLGDQEGTTPPPIPPLDNLDNTPPSTGMSFEA